MSNINDVVVIVCTAGEIVGRLVAQHENEIILKSPRMIGPVENGQLGLYPGVCLSGRPDPDEISFNTSSILFVSPVSDEIEKAWVQATSSIVLQ
jgi:hypothetical protein